MADVFSEFFQQLWELRISFYSNGAWAFCRTVNWMLMNDSAYSRISRSARVSGPYLLHMLTCMI